MWMKVGDATLTVCPLLAVIPEGQFRGRPRTCKADSCQFWLKKQDEPGLGRCCVVITAVALLDGLPTVS
jgi:hypothetical protein